MKTKSRWYLSLFAYASMSTSFGLFIAKALRDGLGKSPVIKADNVPNRRHFRLKVTEVGTESSVSPNSRCGFVTGENP